MRLIIDNTAQANRIVRRFGNPPKHIPPGSSAGRVHASVLSTIGHTPVVRINKLAPQGVNLFAKLESFNPAGSVKDRLALAVIETAEREGTLRAGQTVVEATSGNTGIGLAMVCAQKGYPLVIVMAENFSIERRRLMRYLGARVILTPAAEKGTGMVAKAAELAREHGWFLCRQFENEANARVHAQTTAQEILGDFAGHSLDYFVTGFGTGGTLKGVSQTLRKHSPGTRIIVCEPDNSAMLGSGIKQAYAPDDSPAGSHPSFRPHLMQGISPDFISKLTNEAVREQLFDEIQPVSGEDAMTSSRQLARQEGIFCGISSGAAFAAARAVCERAPEGSNVLCMLPDTGERYMSTALFDGIEEQMNQSEQAISRSTPGYRFDVPGAPSKPKVGAKPFVASSQAARDFVEQVIHRKAEPVVMFSLQWCEFCWSVREFFEQMKIAYHCVNLDSAEYQEDGWGGDIRRALEEKVSAVTIPQIFIGGVHVGGCSETFDAYQDGSLSGLLEKTGIYLDGDDSFDPYSLLPGWLHKR